MDPEETGDVEVRPALQVVSGITPVPGGVGPMTAVVLLGNTLWAFEQSVSPDIV
jgi:methylenetetrahydrofolate dehydrogenase (NADP+)/methenyltetrahydrofolate cyclohydrolase